MTEAKSEENVVRRKPARTAASPAPAVAPVVESAPIEVDEVLEAAAAEEAVLEQQSAPDAATGRDRIAQQLEALKQREAELRRELAMADHPALADAIRSIEGRAYGVSRVEAKMAEGLSKAEQRKKETLEKKLASAIEKRAEIDAQIAAIGLELQPLGEARAQAFARDRVMALLALDTLLREHEAALAAAQLDIASLVPSVATWQAELVLLRADS